MADFIDGIEKLGKGQFVSIPNYENSKGEVANYVINGNITYKTLKENDHEKLMACPAELLQEISTEHNIELNVVETALSELQTSSKKNLSENIEDRTKQSQAQTATYINLGKGLKFNEETQQFHVDGLVVSKKIIVEGNYPTVNSRPKTIAKNVIQKRLGLQKTKYRTFIVNKVEYMNMSGMTVNTL